MSGLRIKTGEEKASAMKTKADRPKGIVKDAKFKLSDNPLENLSRAFIVSGKVDGKWVGNAGDKLGKLLDEMIAAGKKKKFRSRSVIDLEEGKDFVVKDTPVAQLDRASDF